ncbi:hypothetical protein [Brunnivagina elsteri]|nr:hypothetical protein [Calothrix elsteri]
MILQQLIVRCSDPAVRVSQRSHYTRSQDIITRIFSIVQVDIDQNHL